MFAGVYFDVDEETSREIEEIWQPSHWELAAKLTEDKRVLSLAEIIRFKLYQAGFNLKNILYYDQKIHDIQLNEGKGQEMYTFIVKCELDFLFFTLSRMMDLLAGVITIVYGIKITKTNIRIKDFFPSLVNSKPFFNELKRKDPILAEQLSLFYFSAENKLLAGFLNKNGFQTTSLTKMHNFYLITNETKNHAKIYPSRNEELIFNTEMVVKLEKTFREAAYKLGQLMFNHLNYEPILANYFPGYQPLEVSK